MIPIKRQLQRVFYFERTPRWEREREWEKKEWEREREREREREKERESIFPFVRRRHLVIIVEEKLIYPVWQSDHGFARREKFVVGSSEKRNMPK